MCTFKFIDNPINVLYSNKSATVSTLICGHPIFANIYMHIHCTCVFIYMYTCTCTCTTIAMVHVWSASSVHECGQVGLVSTVLNDGNEELKSLYYKVYV